MIEHHVGDYGVKRLIRIRDCLDINDPVFDPAHILQGFFRLIQHAGGLSTRDMFNTFNMGVGMTMTVPAADADSALSILQASGCPDAYILGEIGVRPERVVLC